MNDEERISELIEAYIMIENYCRPMIEEAEEPEDFETIYMAERNLADVICDIAGIQLGDDGYMRIYEILDDPEDTVEEKILRLMAEKPQ